MVDGVVEFVASFNDEQTSRKLIKDLMMLAEEAHCAVVCVLHENKAADDQNMRGHLGTVLAQKAGTVLQCQKSLSGVITVSCPDSRHGQMPEWSIVYDHDGRLYDADEQRQREMELSRMSRKERQQAEKEHREQERLTALLTIIRDAGGSIARKDLKLRLMSRLGIGDSTAQNVIKQNLGQSLCEVNGMIRATEEAALAF